MLVKSVAMSANKIGNVQALIRQEKRKNAKQFFRITAVLSMIESILTQGRAK
jgi:hypothetical protein